MLEPGPGARGVGVDVDAGAVELAGRTLAQRGLADRANVLHYLPMAGRVGFLCGIADLMAPGGVVFLVTTVAAPQFAGRPACPECGDGGLWRRWGSRSRFPTLGVRPGR